MTDMRTDDDLERLLRSTLTTAGDTVTSGPTWSGDENDSLTRLPRHRRRWIAPVAAAAAAAVVAGVVVLSRGTHDDTTPPSTPSPSVSAPVSTSAPTPSVSTPRPTTSHAVVRVANPKQCQTTAPASWQQALQAQDPYLRGAMSSFPLFAAPDGRLLLTRTSGSAGGEVLLQSRTGVRTVLTVPDTYETPYAGWLYRNTAVVPVFGKTPAANGPTLHLAKLDHIELINLRTGAKRVLPPKTAGAQRTGAVFAGSTIYWDERTSTTTGSVVGYDLATGVTSVRYTGALPGRLQASAAAVYVFDAQNPTLPVLFTLPVPTALSHELSTSARYTLTTDGKAWAWWDQKSNTLGWWQPGSKVQHVTSVQIGPDSDDRVPSVEVAGPYVFFMTPNGFVTDTRTGASAPIPAYVDVSGGGRIGAQPSGQGNVVVADTTTLPGLTC